MRLSELNPNEICSVFDRAASINISYSWLGSPSVSIQANGQEYLDELSALEEIAVRAIRNKHSAETPRALIETAYLVNKISQFQEMSKQEIENANCISRLFYRIRDSFLSIFAKWTVFSNDDIDLFMTSYLAMPMRLAQQNGFVNRFRPDHFDSFGGDAMYTQEQALAIRTQLRRA